ncbi:MAG: fumarylacetoacetate hydrolase family protein [Clostridiaceae bacterium]|nr:fumarylacetoacetate hydrolase family protein [Clostridiaceae bacterium]
METNKMDLYRKVASALKEAQETCTPINPISGTYPEFGIKDAYEIQLINNNELLTSGYKITGKKIGLTSIAMQQFVGVDQPDYGELFDFMEVKEGTLERSKCISPKVEGEIAFVLKKDMQGPNVTAKDVMEATDYVLASIEVVDSRIKDWKINIVDTIADNASSIMYVIGDKKVDPNNIDLKTVSMVIYKNGEKVLTGVGADVLGDPAISVAWLINKLWEYGVALKKGEVVLSGSLAAALAGEAGDDFRVVFSELGEVSLKFV